MKTSKLVMIATILAIGMLSIAPSLNVEANPGTRAIHITLEQAVTNPALVQVMYDQLNPSFLGTIDGEYTVTVLFQGMTVYITGSYTEWFLFFQMEKLVNTYET